MAKKPGRDNKSLRESLAESLKQAVPPTTDLRVGGEAKQPVNEKPLEISTAPSPTSASDFQSAELKRTTVSMKAAEQSRADQILEVLQKCRRHRGGLTEAISIALRLCPLDEVEIGRAWDESRATDRRTHKKVKA